MITDHSFHHVEYEVDSESMELDDTLDSNSIIKSGNIPNSMDNDVESFNDIKVNDSTNDDEIVSDNKDPGTKLLYPDLKNSLPLKTSERLLDDILTDLPLMQYINNEVNFNELKYEEDKGNSIMKQQMISYSKLRNKIQPFALGSIVDQIVLQTKFEYKSTTCPNHNKINVFMGVLIDPNQNPTTSVNDISKININHIKITVKTRTVLERTRKLIGLSKYHQIDELHIFDKQDLLTFDKTSDKLIDYAIYVSDDTNKLILIEIFKPEFDSEEERLSLTDVGIKDRYLKTLSNEMEPNPDNIPTQIDCINTLFKIFKGPLTRQSSDDPIKRISSNNAVLNLHLNPEWLTSKYGFDVKYEIDEETGEEMPEYEPLDLTNYINDFDVRRIREATTRKCLELVFLGKMAVNTLPREQLEKSSKALRTFNLFQTTFSTSFWSQLLEERGVGLPIENLSNYNTDYHYIDLSVSYHYSERNIIQLFETISEEDPKNIGRYYDSLQFIANTKGAYQLISYCSKLDIVGQETIETAIKTFNLDPSKIDLMKLDDSVIMSLYQSELKNKNLTQSRHKNLRNSLRLFANYKKSSRLRFYVDFEPYINNLQAYNMLEVDESVDDDIIQTAYSIKVNDAPGLKIDCDRALYTVAITKRSISLFNFLLQECPIFQEYYGPDTVPYSTALELFQLNENASDETILEVFQRKWFHESILEYDQLLRLKAALTKIAFERNSKLISHFLETGVIDPSCLPAENWPTGLNNIGNTCYLNSLLQYYFSISPLRDEILKYQKSLENVEDKLSINNRARRVGGRVTNRIEVERSVQFVYQLRDLFSEMIYTQSRCVTPKKELAYLAFAPSNVEVEFESENSTNVSNSDNNESPNELNEVLIDFDNDKTDNLKMESKSVVSPLSKSTSRVAKISIDQLENALEMGRQQDVTECIGNVLTQLESASTPISLDEDDEQNDLIKKLFFGKTKQSIIPIDETQSQRNKIERFLSLLVNIGDHPKDIYDALDLYFNDELLHMEEYGDVRKTLSIAEFPSILQIQIQRVYYDRERFMPFKSIEPLPFGNTLYMDRYAETENPELLQAKKETSRMKTELVKMKETQKELLSKNELGLSRKESLIETKRFLMSDTLENNGIDIASKDVLIKQIEENLVNIDKELSMLFNNIREIEGKIAKQFENFQSIRYDLFAVFIHRGEASYGHYWVYIKDFEQNNIWRKYNDETITEVPESEVFNFVKGNTATPYFLVYVKKEDIKEIKPLNRIISEV